MSEIDLRRLLALVTEQAEEIKALNEVLDDKRRLTRELDVAMNGEEDAAKQASLIDLIAQAKSLRSEASRVIEVVKAKRERWRNAADGATANHRHGWNGRVKAADEILAELNR